MAYVRTTIHLIALLYNVTFNLYLKTEAFVQVVDHVPSTTKEAVLHIQHYI